MKKFTCLITILKHQKIVFGLLVLAAIALMPSVARADVCGDVPGNIVANCGFETGSFAPWTTSGNCPPGACDVVNFNAHSGTHSARLGPIGSDGFLSQTLSTVAGTTYHIEFWLMHNAGSTCNPTTCHFAASWGGVEFYLNTSSTSFPYTLVAADMVATGASTVLQFRFREDPPEDTFYWLDDVSVSAGVIPEPGSLALLGSGLSLFAGFARRRLSAWMV